MLTLGPILAVGSTSAVSSMKQGSMLREAKESARGELYAPTRVWLRRNDVHLGLDSLGRLRLESGARFGNDGGRTTTEEHGVGLAIGSKDEGIGRDGRAACANSGVSSTATRRP